MRFTRMSQKAALSLALVGVVALSTQAATISLSINTITDADGGLARVVAGDNVWFEVGVDVTVAASNVGLATLVYDVIAQQTTPLLSGMLDAFSGFQNTGNDGDNITDSPAVVSNNYYTPDANNSLTPNYGGGWGFNRAGLPGDGDVTSNPGDIEAAGATAPLTWTADNHPELTGLQPISRLNVGNGLFTFGADDPELGGVQGGFGFLHNTITQETTLGDGTWIIQIGHIDTTGWTPGTYSFNINPTAGAVYDGTLNYTTDIPGGFRVDVPTNDMTGTSFSFTIIPEPATLGLLLLGGLSMVRRRRQ